MVVLALYLALALVMTWPLASQLSRAIPGDSFDGWQNYWNLWWMRQAWLVNHQSPYVTSILHFPTGADLRFQTMAPFNGLAFLNVQLATNVFVAYNLAVLFSFVAGGYGGYLLALYALRTARGPRQQPSLARHGAAFVAGVVFAFSPYHFAHLLGHLQLIALQWLPFFALYLLRGLDRSLAGQPPHRSDWLADAGKAALFLALVGLCDWYYVMYCLLLTAVVLVVRLLQRQLTWRSVRLAAGAFGLAALMLAPLLLPLVQGARAWTGTSLLRDYSETVTLSADLLAFVTPQAFHPLWGDWAAARSAVFTASRSEYSVFAGYTVLILAGVAILAMRTSDRRGVTLWAASALTFFVLALGPVLHVAGQTAVLPGGGAVPLPYRWLYDLLPFMKLTRSVSRLDVMVMLSLGVLAAFGLMALSSWLDQRWARARWRPAVLAPAVATALIVFEFLPAPYPMSPPDTPAWYETLAQDPSDAAVLNLPANWPRPGYLLYQTVHGKPLTTGYLTRDDPNTLLERAPVLSQLRWLGPDVHTKSFDLETHGMQVLHDLLGVGWVVLDRYKMPSGLERDYTEQAARAIFAATGQGPLYEDERLTVYAVQEPTQRRPYLILGPDWPPRQADERGSVQRVLPRGAASVELVQPQMGDLRFTVNAQGSNGAILKLVDGAGLVLAEWPVDDQPTVVEVALKAQAPGKTTLYLQVDGPPSATVTVHAIDVEPLETP